MSEVPGYERSEVRAGSVGHDGNVVAGEEVPDDMELITKKLQDAAITSNVLLLTLSTKHSTHSDGELLGVVQNLRDRQPTYLISIRFNSSLCEERRRI